MVGQQTVGRRVVAASGTAWRGSRARRPAARLWGDEPTPERMKVRAWYLCWRLASQGRRLEARRVMALLTERIEEQRMRSTAEAD